MQVSRVEIKISRATFFSSQDEMSFQVQSFQQNATKDDATMQLFAQRMKLAKTQLFRLDLASSSRSTQRFCQGRIGANSKRTSMQCDKLYLLQNSPDIIFDVDFSFSSRCNLLNFALFCFVSTFSRYID